MSYVAVKLESLRIKLESLSKSLGRNRERESLVIEFFFWLLLGV